MSHITPDYIPYGLHSPVGSRGYNNRRSPPIQGLRQASPHTSLLSLSDNGDGQPTMRDQPTRMSIPPSHQIEYTDRDTDIQAPNSPVSSEIRFQHDGRHFLHDDSDGDEDDGTNGDGVEQCQAHVSIQSGRPGHYDTNEWRVVDALLGLAGGETMHSSAQRYDQTAVKPVNTNVTGIKTSNTSTQLTYSTSLASRPLCVTVSSTQPSIPAVPSLSALPHEALPLYPPFSRDYSPVTRLPLNERYRLTDDSEARYTLDKVDRRNLSGIGYQVAENKETRPSYKIPVSSHRSDGVYQLSRGSRNGPSLDIPLVTRHKFDEGYRVLGQHKINYARDQTPVRRFQSDQGYGQTDNGHVKHPRDVTRHQSGDGYKQACEGQARHSHDYIQVMRHQFDDGHVPNPRDQTPVMRSYLNEAHTKYPHDYEHVIGRQLDDSADYPCDYQLATAHRSEVTIDGSLDERHHIQKRQVYPYRDAQNNWHGVQYPQEHNFPGIYAPEEIPVVGRQPTQREHVYGVRNTDSPARRQDLSVKTKRPTQYDGRSSCRDYLVQFEMISKMNRWDNTTCALELATSLSGQALAVLTDIEPCQRENYGTLVNALLTRFEPDNQSEVFRAQLKCRVRKQGEGLAELGQDIKRLVRKAYPEASNSVRDTLARDAFSDALNDYELERSISRSHGTSLDAALRVALEEEAFQKGRQRRLGTKTIVRSQVERTRNQISTQSSCTPETNLPDAPALTDDIISRITQLVLDQTGKQSANKNYRQPQGKCHNCGKTGHYIRDCKLKRDSFRQKLKCEYCQRTGHVITDCYTKKRKEESPSLPAEETVRDNQSGNDV